MAASARSGTSRSSEVREDGAYTSHSQVRLKQGADNTQVSLESALAEVERTPERLLLWDALEELAEVEDRPEPVADAYMRALSPELHEGLRDELARRAYAFYERWFGDDVDCMQRLLFRVLEVQGDLEWAFDALVRLLTVAGRWDALLDAYQMALGANLSRARRAQLLSDFVRTAKDFAHCPERAIVALRELFALDPSQMALARSLARTFRERKAFAPLVELLEAMLAHAREDERIALHLELAGLHCVELGSPALALEHAAKVLRHMPGHEPACALLEQVLAAPSTPRALRLEALRLIRLHHDSAGRPEHTVAALEKYLPFVTGEEALAIRRELTHRLMMLGEHMRAMGHAQAVLELDPRDPDARLNLHLLAHKSGAHERHAEALVAAAEASSDPSARTELLLSAMRIRAERLVQQDDAALLEALEKLYARSGRDEELASVLAEVAERHRAFELDVLCRLGDLARTKLSQPERAVRAYAEALERVPGFARAREGLRALLAEPACAGAAVLALWSDCERTDDWQGMVALLDARLAHTSEPVAQANLMLRVAELLEERAKDSARAQSLVARALTRVPSRVHVERELVRLAEQTGRLREAAQALHWAAAVASSDRQRAADLSALEARLLERLDDARGAAEAYLAVVSVRPHAREETLGLVRSAARARDFALACRTAVAWFAREGRLEADMLATLMRAAEANLAFSSLRDALREAVGEYEKTLHPALVSALQRRIAALCLEQLDDAAGAEQALTRALASVPDEPSTLALLAEVQRRLESPGLIDTLLALDAHAPSLAHLSEAARVAEERGLSRSQRTLWTRLYARARDAWLEGYAVEKGQRLCICALEHLVALDVAEGELGSAIARLDDAARLPLTPEQRARWRRESAELLARHGERAEALLAGMSALAALPDDLGFVRFLAELADELGALPQKIALRQRELVLVRTEDERLQVRLELSRLMGVVEGEDARLHLLRANLAEKPAHEPSLGAVIALLTSQHRFAELVALLSEQAELLVGQGQKRKAAALLRRAAELSEVRLKEPWHAIEFLERVISLDEDEHALSETVRLCLVVNDHARASRWLGRKLALCTMEERPELSLSLARTQLAADEREKAIATLKDEFVRAPCHGELAELLVVLLREAERTLELAEVLHRLALLASDKHEAARLGREAAQLYHVHLRAGADACAEPLVEVADLSLGVHADDVVLCCVLADGLSVLGRHRDARHVLVHALKQFGRRRSAERAAVHVQLAEVYRAEGQLERSCAELELALTMRADDPAIMYALAERAGEAGDLGRRERALRALYLAVKRGPVTLDEQREVGLCEVLLMLSEVAAQRGDAVQASSLRESALSALRFDDPECARIKERLRSRGPADLLEHILRAELSCSVGEVARASVLNELATLLEANPARHEQALALRMEAVELDPSHPALHDAAYTLARRLSAESRLRALLEALRERLRRPSDAYARCEVCLRLGALSLATGDTEGALAYYEEARATGTRETDVLRAELELAITRGDVATQERLLKELDRVGGSELEGEGRIDVLYRMAEIRLGHEQTRAEGVVRMREAIAEALRPVRAARVLLRARSARRDDAELLALFKDVARASGELDLLQVAEQCAHVGDAEALEALIDVAAESGRPQLRATLLVARARMLLAEDADSERLPQLLCEALSVRPDDADAETLLLEHYRRTGATRDALDYLSAGFALARAAGDKDGATRLALRLYVLCEQALEGELGQAVLTTTRTVLTQAIELMPAHVGLREALLACLPRESSAWERAKAIESALEHSELRDAVRLALEAADIFRGLRDHSAASRVLSLGLRRAPRNMDLLRALVDAVRELAVPDVLSGLLEQLASQEAEPRRRAEHLREAAQLKRRFLGDPEGSLRLLEQAVEALPDDARLRHGLAEELLSAGELERAISHLGHAALRTRDPRERAALLLMRGRALLSLQDLPRALEDFEQAVRLDEEAALPDLVRVLEAASRPDQPRELRRRTTLRLAALRVERGETLLALKLLEGWVAVASDDDEALEQLASLYRRLDLPDALARVLFVQLESPGRSRDAAALARELVELLPRLRAQESVRKALERAHDDPARAEAVEDALIDALVYLGDHRATATLLRARAERAEDPKERAAYLRRVAQQLVAGDAIGEAAEVLLELRSLVPHDVDTAVHLADTLLAQGRFGETRLLLDALNDSTLDGNHAARARVLTRLARAVRGQGDGQGALALLSAARDADKTDRTILAELAVLAESIGAWDVAERSLTSLLLLNDVHAMPRAELLLRRARVARQRAGIPQALLWAKKAVAAAPASVEARALLRELEAL